MHWPGSFCAHQNASSGRFRDVRGHSQYGILVTSKILREQRILFYTQGQECRVWVTKNFHRYTRKGNFILLMSGLFGQGKYFYSCELQFLFGYCNNHILMF